MAENFAQILAVGGKTNSLGRAQEVVDLVLSDEDQLAELYRCVFNDDAWVRMRAIDSMEKICRLHPDWLVPYIDRFQSELAHSEQPSIQWHLAQIYRQIDLTALQKRHAIQWLTSRLEQKDVDWIVAAQAMTTLVQFTHDGAVPKKSTIALLKLQQSHTSKSVVKRATKLLAELAG